MIIFCPIQERGTLYWWPIAYAANTQALGVEVKRFSPGRLRTCQIQIKGGLTSKWGIFLSLSQQDMTGFLALVRSLYTSQTTPGSTSDAAHKNVF